MNSKELRYLVQSEVEQRIEQKRIVKISWVTHAIVTKRNIPEGFKDRGFFVAATYHGVEAIVRDIIRKYKTDESSDATQLILPGYERLQCVYSIERDGSPCIVPIEQLTAAELESKIQRLLANAKGLKQHALEMRRYLEEKFDHQIKAS
jgi:hypothetical protein